MDLTLDQLSDWLQRYFHAWDSNDPAEVSALFSEEAIYYYGPLKDPARNRETIVKNWVADPEGQKDVSYNFEALATNGDIGIAHWHVAYKSKSQEMKRIQLDGILVLRFNASLECVEHREWYATEERG